MKIYLASSWRNSGQPGWVKFLRDLGHEVYDFRNPPMNTGFQWTRIDPNWLNWTPAELVDALKHPTAESGFTADFDAMKWCDVCLMLMPCGRSAHLELGWAAGAGKKTGVILADGCEPELMIKVADRIFLTTAEVVDWLASLNRAAA